ncbi:MAG: carboxypeptidase M32, partial [Sulfolobales archaeon]
EIERLAIAGEIRVSDIPELWNDLMEKNLGIKPKKHSEGVLQDIHWSNGSIGYFPTYTIGTIVAAQIREAVERDLGDLADHISRKNLNTIREWLREKIHRWGATYPPKHLIKIATGKDIEPKSYIKYLQRKYLERTI